MTAQTFSPSIPIELIENLPIAIYTCDAEGKITYFNKAATELWGRVPTLGKELWCGSWKVYYTDGTAIELSTSPIALTLSMGEAVTGKEIIIERPNGERRNVLPHPQPLFDATGKVSGAINMLVDITEKRQQDALIYKSEKDYRELNQTLGEKVEERTAALRLQMDALKKSEDRYHRMVEEVRDYAILLLDVDGTVLNWNKGAEKIKGYTEKEIVGKNFRIFYLSADRENKVPEKLIEEATLYGKATNEGFRLRKDGSTFWGSIVITALHDEQQNIIGFSKVTRDLTDKKLAEDQLIEYAKKLESQNRELAQFNYVASHDLQEPLRKIQTFISLCNDELDNKESVQKYFAKIDQSSRRMGLLIKNLLEYSRISDGEKEFVETDLNQVLQNIVEDFELPLKAKQATVKYTGLPVIKAVPFQIYQLFSNLLSNSLKFTEQQPLIEISAGLADKALTKDYAGLNSKTSYIHIVFKDNGIGFDPVYSEQIFTLFNRLNDNSRFPGSGVGLAICKKIIENHHGYISAQSELNKGAVFNIFLATSIDL